MKNIVLISKDAMCRDYLPVYGNSFWNTPNINDIASKGTVFNNHYTAASSTVMSFFSTITGVFSHETNYEMYEKIHDDYQGETIFTKLKKKGYECHILWDSSFSFLPEYFDCYKDNVQFHTIENLRQGVGAHYIHDGFLKENKEKEQKMLEVFEKKIKELLFQKENVFVWIHFPHVINGKVSYGSDIELFDKYIGIIRKYTSDDSISITADHGNMNGHRGKIGYGFDVYQPIIRIPLITSRIDNMKSCNVNTSNVDLYSIIVDKKIVEREFIYSDTAYRAQRHRKLAIIYKNYKYIYNKKTNTEELYDLNFDPLEEFSIMNDYLYDVDRKFNAPSRELYYYSNWDNIENIRNIMRNEKNRIWKNGSFKYVLKNDIKMLIRPFYEKLTRKKIK